MGTVLPTLQIKEKNVSGFHFVRFLDTTVLDGFNFKGLIYVTFKGILFFNYNFRRVGIFSRKLLVAENLIVGFVGLF